MDVDFELVEIDLSDKPRRFVELSPTGKVPMLVEDDYVLYESQVINDYLVEEHGWGDAYAKDRRTRFSQKVCMKQWDSTILGPVYDTLGDPPALDEAWEDIQPELDYLQSVVDRTDAETDSLFAFHFAPFWARFSWLSDYTPFPERVRDMDLLGRWLDSTLSEPPVAETLPDRDWAVKQYEEHYVDD